MTSKRLIIGLAGQIGSGKTTAAQELYHIGFTRIRFAGPLKAMAKCIGLNDQQVDGDLKETPADVLGGMTPRRFMQLIGTEFGRQMICDDLWIRAWSAAIDRLPEHIPVVCDDIRFANEAQAIKAKGGIVARMKRRAVPLAINHASELIDFPVELEIDNNGSIQELNDKLLLLVQMARVTP